MEVDPFVHRFYTGTLVALRADTIAMNRDVGGPLAVPILRVAQLQRSRGPGRCSRDYNRGKCIVAGALIGAVVTALPAIASGNYGAAVYLRVVPPIALIAGGIAGGLVGGERWERVPIPTGE